VRRIVAVTGSEAEAAIKEGDRLSEEVAAAGGLTDVNALESKVSALKQVCVVGIHAPHTPAQLVHKLHDLCAAVSVWNEI
jgi:hypothetical protein